MIDLDKFRKSEKYKELSKYTKGQLILYICSNSCLPESYSIKYIVLATLLEKSQKTREEMKSINLSAGSIEKWTTWKMLKRKEQQLEKKIDELEKNMA